MIKEYAQRPDSWRAKWIWHDNEIRKNTYAHFRRVYTVTSKPEKGILYITACSEYKIWINGEEVGRGPVTSDPRWQSYDSYDVSCFLTKGENVIGVLCYYSDEGMEDDSRRKFRSESPGNIPYSMHWSRPGLLCQLELNSLGNCEYCNTDDSWKSCISNAWKCDVPKLDDRSHIEVYDAAKWPEGWNAKGFDDRCWVNATMLEGTDTFAPIPWTILEPRDMPHFKKQEVTPVKIVKEGEVTEYIGVSNPALKMSLEHIKEPVFTRISNVEGFIRGEKIEIEPFNHDITYDEFNGVRSATIILDMGKLFNGRVGFDIEGSAGGVIDIGYAPRLEDGNPVIYSSRTSAADRYIMKEGRQNWTSFGWRHFRYVQLTFRDLEKPLHIYNFKTIADLYGEDNKGEFYSSDDLLNWLWDASANTTYACATDLFMDAPGRERRQYTAEVADMVLSHIALYGDAAIVRRYLRTMLRGQTVYGLLTSCNPSGYEKNTLLLNGPCRLFEAIWQHYLRFGDISLLHEAYIPVRRHLDFMDNYRGKDGLIGKQPFFVWQDWSEIDNKEKLLTLNVSYAREQQLAGMMFREIGQDNISQALLKRYEETRQSVEKVFWDNERGVYVDNVSYENVRYDHVSEQGNFMMLSFGYTDRKRSDRILDYWKKHDGDMGQTSSLWFYYVMEGLFRNSYSQEAFEIIKRRYNRFKKYGYTTLPELWSIYGSKATNFKAWGRGWRPFDIRAVAHGGTVCPSYIIQKYILGVSPAEIGCGKVEITPGLCQLDWVQGVVPVPQGNIKVSWSREKGKLKLSCELPDGITGIVRPPNSDKTVEIKGKAGLEF